jgi:hypothetical protein
VQAFDYVTVLLAIVISLALAHLLTGIAHIIQDGVRSFSIPLAQWILFSLFLCVDYWFYVWHLHGESSWSLAYVSLLLAQASIIFVAARIIVPGGTNGSAVDMTAFFERNRRKYMAVVFVLAASNELINLSLPGFGSLQVGLLVAAWLFLFTVGWVFSSPRVQLAIAAANVMLTAYYAVTFVPSL